MRNRRAIIRRASGRTALLGALLALTLPALTPAQQGDPAIGTWKLNVARSRYSPGPAPKTSTLTIEPSGTGLRVTASSIGSDGTPTTIRYTANIDGKDYKVIGSSDYDTVALTRKGAIVEGTRKKEGKAIQTYTREISADGRTMTVTSTGRNASGQRINNIAVYDKQ
jgi:hypothetical protein